MGTKKPKRFSARSRYPCGIEGLAPGLTVDSLAYKPVVSNTI